MIGGYSELSSTDRIQTTESDAVQIMSQLLKTYEVDCDNVDNSHNSHIMLTVNYKIRFSSVPRIDIKRVSQ